MKVVLVVTTIGDGRIVEHYAAALAGIPDIEMIVIPDRKTPGSLYGACQRVKQAGFQVRCPDLSEQQAYLKRIGPIAPLIPFDSDNRRNIGFLMAIESGCDFLVSLDDDNYCLDGAGFIKEHSIVNQASTSGDLVSSSTGWANICNLLKKDPDRPLYPRGFPYKYRFKNETLSTDKAERTVAVNAGLWLGDPDVDAVSRLNETVKTVGHDGSSWVLGPQAWTPINTQNTAVSYEAIAAYYYVRMGYPLGGLPIDRYGDILSGYFLQACVYHMRQAVRVGTPVANHIRNQHDVFKDLANELWCMWMLEDMCDWLTELKLNGNTYLEAYRCLADALEEFTARVTGSIWTDSVRGFLFQTVACMHAWGASCRLLGIR